MEMAWQSFRTSAVSDKHEVGVVSELLNTTSGYAASVCHPAGLTQSQLGQFYGVSKAWPKMPLE
jgi:hypothetical protein